MAAHRPKIKRLRDPAELVTAMEAAGLRKPDSRPGTGSTELASYIGVSRQYVAGLMSGKKTTINPDAAAKMERILRVELFDTVKGRRRRSDPSVVPVDLAG